jgi:hypothetical protein
MADEKPTLHIDNDWKRQAQEEKKRLIAEQEAKKAAAAAPAPAATVPAATAVGPAPRGAARPRGEAFPEANFATLVQSLMTQALFYLGELNPRGGEPTVNLDMAKHQIDTLTVLEDKTKGNLSDDEKRVMDLALYETRNRFVSVASQYIN